MAGAGGGADQIALFVQSVVEANDMTNRPLVPTNRGGGSGAEALLHLTNVRDPDHTIMVTLNSFYTTPIRQEALGIDIETFTPLTMMGVDPFVLWAHKESGITTFEQYLDKVKSMNGEFVMGGTGAGRALRWSQPHLHPLLAVRSPQFSLRFLRRFLRLPR